MDSGFTYDDALRIKQDRQEKMWQALQGVRSSILSTIRQNAMVHKKSECLVTIPSDLPNFPEYDISVVAISMKRFLMDQGFTVQIDSNDNTILRVDWKLPTGEATSSNTALKLALPLDHPHTILAKRVQSEIMSLIRECCYLGRFQCFYRISSSDYESSADLERLIRWLCKRAAKRGFVLQRTQEVSTLYWSIDGR